MKVYRVKIEKLTSDWGRFDGWRELGYYVNKAKAEEVGKDFSDSHNHIDFGKVKIDEIEVIE